MSRRFSAPDRRVRFLNRASLYVFGVASVRYARLECWQPNYTVCKMKSVLGISASKPVKPKPSPLEGSGNFRVLPDGSNPQQVLRREWWLWLSALLVTALSAVAFLLTSIHSFFRHADYFYEIRADQARWATLCLILLFNGWLVYRQWSFRRLRKLAAGFANDAQAMPAQAMELAGLDPITGLFTRSSLEQHLGKEIARAR